MWMCFDCNVRCSAFTREWSVCLGEQHYGPVWARAHVNTNYQTQESAWSRGGIDPADHCWHFSQPGLDCSSNRQVKSCLVWNKFKCLFSCQSTVHSVSCNDCVSLVLWINQCHVATFPLSIVLSCWTVFFPHHRSNLWFYLIYSDTFLLAQPL